MTAFRTSSATGQDQNITISVNGQPVPAVAGESLAAALAAAGVLRLRSAPRTGAPRGAFCFMGVCQECAILIDGTFRQACLVPVEAGMVVELKGAVG